ncbi:putative quinol monooxygenase [Burkholderia sp. PU8-34]
MTEIAVVALIVAKPGAEEKLRTVLEGIVKPTRNEPGALQYDLHRDLKEPARFVFVERWESEAALAAHARSAHILAYREAAADWIASSEIRVLSKIV